MKPNKKKCSGCDSMLETFMSYCPACGKEQKISVGRRGPKCPGCSVEVSNAFNFCYACDEDLSPEEWLPEVQRSASFQLYWECDSECGGNVASHMNYCPSCGDEQMWWGIWSDEKDCATCTSGISEAWDYCPYCGEEVDEDDEDDGEALALVKVVTSVAGGAIGTVIGGPAGGTIGAAGGGYAAKPAYNAAKEHGPRVIKSVERVIKRLY